MIVRVACTEVDRGTQGLFSSCAYSHLTGNVSEKHLLVQLAPKASEIPRYLEVGTS